MSGLDGHDPLCPMQEPEPGDTVRQSSCLCYLIANVRADERERGLATVYGYELGEAEARADLRAKVEALRNEAADSPDQWDDYSEAAFQTVLDLLDGNEQ